MHKLELGSDSNPSFSRILCCLHDCFASKGWRCNHFFNVNIRNLHWAGKRCKIDGVPNIFHDGS
jgi:hypothetical protein